MTIFLSDRSPVPRDDDFGALATTRRAWALTVPSTAAPSTQEVLAGLVERVTYHNAENGFCVLRTKARGHMARAGADHPTARFRRGAEAPRGR
jgi:hypothetical protein